MIGVQALDSQLNIEEQMGEVIEKTTPAAVPVRVECPLPLHRLGEARRQENISRGTVARRLGVTVDEVRRQECETTDLPLSMLHKWAKVLDQPVTELVEETGNSLSMPLFNRAHMVRVMKTAMTILERGRDPRTKRLAQTMVDQLAEIMPELRGMVAWQIVGKRRRRNELGIAAERRLPDEFFRDAAD
jgi:transcriptional regulator with XRE-family HTH domain